MVARGKGAGEGGQWVAFSAAQVVDSFTGHALLHLSSCGPVVVRHVLLFFCFHVASLGDGSCPGSRHTADIQC